MPEEPIQDDENVLDETKSAKDSMMESIEFVVNMMNSGKVNAKDVYPPGRYHGD